ncbi:choice-of-anchor I family protein [Aquimarina sp. RZ0]|uniref:choice-of-anchor I family protein n=1 Tax=Aquimarina sp. RZ0 TaxID=2607730 RepID=UPI0011F1A89F|nr:choice-of-anchor I family protein [Aquimarina sp. RZ0]KAA1245401.1 alkaline phosphatase [Aquimarina sp. RZ0]
MKFLKKIIASAAILGVINSCDSDDDIVLPSTDTSALTFNKIGSLKNGMGDEGFAEISAFDPTTNKLFIVNPNDAEISVWDLSDPVSPVSVTDIPVDGIPNSVAAYNGIVAVALENINKQANGVIATYNAETQVLLNTYDAGALPDMVTFSPDGTYIVAANEGEPNDDYTLDPEGSVTIINLNSGEAANATFTTFNNQTIGNNFRVFGKEATLTEDVEPEYIAISDDAKTAYVSLQENNGLAVVDLESKTITELLGLGVKDHSLPENQLDASNKDGISGNFKNWPVFGMYQPDAIKYVTIGGTGYIISANEGDARDYDGFSEERRLKDLQLDPEVFPNAAMLQEDENLGELKITTANGDIDGDGDFDKIYCYGGRSFTIWSTSGDIIYDSADFIGKKTYELEASLFNNDEGVVDDRSDDKGAEPEAIETLRIGDKTLLFVGLERTGGVMIFDITNPVAPQFLDWIIDASDQGPEGLLAVEASDSPTGKDLLIITNEVSNTVAIYEIE